MASRRNKMQLLRGSYTLLLLCKDSPVDPSLQLPFLLGRCRLPRGTSSTAIPQLAPPKVRLSSSRARSFCGSAVGALHVKSWHTYAVALQHTAHRAGLRLLCVIHD